MVLRKRFCVSTIEELLQDLDETVLLLQLDLNCEIRRRIPAHSRTRLSKQKSLMFEIIDASKMYPQMTQVLQECEGLSIY